jgi:EmrB/QacA subfamily drug resistance transporter
MTVESQAVGLSQRQRTLTLVATCLGLFLAQMDTTAVNLALPAIGNSLGGGLAGLQWVMDGYNLAFAALLLTGGTMGDRFGRRRMFLVGVWAFVFGSLVCAIAPTLAVMVAGRGLQGFGAAIMLPQSLAILATTFPGRSERNQAMAAWSAVAGIALAIGPTAGGFLVEAVGWQYIFWVNLPVGIAAVILARVNIVETANPNAGSLDLSGQLVAIGFLAALTFAVVEGQRAGWVSTPIVLAAAVAVVCLVGFLLIERGHPSPMLPLNLIRRGQLPVAAVVAMCMTFGMYGLLMLASLHLQQQRGDDALRAGIEMLPLPVVFALASPMAGRLVTRFGPKVPMGTGMTLMGVGLLGYAAVGGDADLPWLFLMFAVIGLGLSLNTGPVVGVAVAAVEPDRAGLASGVANLARMFGATLGVAVLGTVLGMVSGGAPNGPEFLAGLRAALLVGAAVELTGAVVAFAAIRNPPKGG